jgi:hypothetical protein
MGSLRNTWTRKGRYCSPVSTATLSKSLAAPSLAKISSHILEFRARVKVKVKVKAVNEVSMCTKAHVLVIVAERRCNGHPAQKQNALEVHR